MKDVDESCNMNALTCQAAPTIAFQLCRLAAQLSRTSALSVVEANGDGLGVATLVTEDVEAGAARRGSRRRRHVRAAQTLTHGRVLTPARSVWCQTSCSVPVGGWSVRGAASHSLVFVCGYCRHATSTMRACVAHRDSYGCCR